VPARDAMIEPIRRATVLRLPEVKARTGLGRTSIYDQQANGLFPPNFNLTSRAVGWLESEVDAVLAARAAGAEDQELKALIVELVAARRRSLTP
jgi:prophage regulatory protein